MNYNYNPKFAQCFEDEILVNNSCEAISEISTSAELFDKHFFINLVLNNTLQLLLAVLCTVGICWLVFSIFGRKTKNKKFNIISKNYKFKNKKIIYDK